MSSARVAGHMSAQRPPNHRVPWRVTGRYTLIQGHTHAQSHGHTQSHGRTQAHTHTGSCPCRSHWFCHPVWLASWPARMLTVVLELGFPHTKSLPRLLAALWASLAHRLPTHLLPPDPGCREDAAAAPAGAVSLTGGQSPLPIPCSSQNSLAGPSLPFWRGRQSRKAVRPGLGFWLWVCMHS